jgi:prepilin-type processing-associated H-X9-DG protein
MNMIRPQTLRNRGITIVELLIVVAIIGLLLQLALPAIHQARESARRLQCAHQMRQIGTAMNGYTAAHRRLPPGYVVKPHRHNFVQFVSPYLEESAIFQSYRFDVDWNDQKNISSVRNEIKLLRCPTAPRKYKYTSDYAVFVRINPELANSLLSDGMISNRSDMHGALSNKEANPSAVTDGMSKTVFLCEVAGRPDKYELGKRVTKDTLTGSRWASPAGRFDLKIRCNGGALDTGSQLFNCVNKNEIYSFHPQGANFLFGDASVRYITDGIAPDPFVSMLTSRAGD